MPRYLHGGTYPVDECPCLGPHGHVSRKSKREKQRREESRKELKDCTTRSQKPQVIVARVTISSTTITAEATAGLNRLFEDTMQFAERSGNGAAVQKTRPVIRVGYHLPNMSILTETQWS